VEYYECAVIVLDSSAQVNLTLTVDDTLVMLYIDGVQVPSSALPNAADWKKVDVVPIQRQLELLPWKA